MFESNGENEGLLGWCLFHEPAVVVEGEPPCALGPARVLCGAPGLLKPALVPVSPHTGAQQPPCRPARLGRWGDALSSRHTRVLGLQLGPGGRSH